MRCTKIVCTLGPASREPEVLRQMIQAGMNVARLNMSHGDHLEHHARLAALKKLDATIPIIADLQGPRIRTGFLKNKKINLIEGKKVKLTAQKIIGDEKLVSLSPATVFSHLRQGETILLSDGTIKLQILTKQAGQAECLVVNGGILGEHKGVNLPGTRLKLPSLTTKDKADVDWAIDQNVDYLALSFIRNARDILALKKILRAKRADIPVIAKIEKAEAVENLKEIIAVADGVMVARGDLGVELSLEKVPVLQKEIIELCQKMEKPVIVATQMLESMVKEPGPTRAEVSDVANAIFDGTDAVMLSEETSIGSFPVEAVKMMARIVTEADQAIRTTPLNFAVDKNVDVAVAHAACVLAKVIKAGAIITFTETGSTALRVSKNRPDVPIYGVVTNDKTLRRLGLFFGVHPLKTSAFRYIEEMIVNTEQAILKTGDLKKNDLVVITAGVPVNIRGTTNLIKVHRIGEKKTL
jgi:pyruvate kinase